MIMKDTTEYKKFIIDLESKPQEDLIDIYTGTIKAPKTYKDEEKIKEYIKKEKAKQRKKMSVDPDFASIICIGIRELGCESKLYNLEDMPKWFKDNPKPVFISFNGKKFDMKLLIKAGLKKDLDLPYQMLKVMTKRYSTEWHIDLQEVICDNEYKSLDTLLQVYCGVSKKPINFETASEEEIKIHCREDLVNSEKLYNKFKKII